MKAKSTVQNIRFLSGSGEMAKLTRAKDWSKTSLGDVEDWPQSLKTTLGILLNSKFPMFLWWGPELICFYNDAYRPSLGINGKHPDILGMRAEEAWPEIWDIIKPLIDQVLAGGDATWSEDQLIPIYRNGKIEDVYWTFSYSPVKDETENIAAVLVTCNETTEKVNAFKSLEESNRRYLNNIQQAPVAMCIFRGKDHVVEIANELMLELWGKTAGEVMNKPIFEGLPEAKGQGFEKLLDDVYNTGEKFVANEHPVNLPRNGDMETIFINFMYEALRNPNGSVSGIVAIATDLTSQVLARKKIEESGEKLNIVISASELGTWEWNIKTDEVNYSEKYLEIFGYKNNSALTHLQLLEHLHPEDILVREKALKRAIATSVLNYESRVIWNDGSIHWIEARGKVFYDESNQPIKLIGTIRDKTDERMHEQELSGREQKFRLLADSMPQLVWTGDAEGNLNYFNQSVYNYSGLSGEQIEKEGWIQIVHPDEREQNIAKWLHSIKTGSDFLFEHRFRRYDGEYRWQLSRAIPQRDANGKIQMWVGTSTDIEDQKMFASELERQVQERVKELRELNRALKKSEERYHLMVEEVQDYAILYLNKQGVIENWNKGAEKIKGYKADEIIGTNFSVFYTQSDREEGIPTKLLNKATKDGKAVQQGWRVRKDGSPFWASVVITAVHDEQQNVIGFSKVTHDLTEKKAADDKLKMYASELERKNRELQAMNIELQSFAYVSSHDLQEPLRKIQVFAAMINENEKESLSENAKDYFRRMQTAAARMQTLIKDLLTYSRTNITERNFEKIDLNVIMEEVKMDLKEDIQQKHATIEATGLCEMKIIPFQFRQLLNNLVGNALKFSKPGIAPYIKLESLIEKGNKLSMLRSDALDDYCHIRISDNGIGFDPLYKEKIFEVFQRLHGKNEYKGTGIGLAIVKKIVENHNGIITATGELGKGATFDIYFPV